MPFLGARRVVSAMHYVSSITSRVCRAGVSGWPAVHGGLRRSRCLRGIPGLHVIATARRAEVLSEMAEIGMTTLTLDVTDAESIKACHAQVAELTGGKLDILINNA